MITSSADDTNVVIPFVLVTENCAAFTAMHLVRPITCIVVYPSVLMINVSADNASVTLPLVITAVIRAANAANNVV